MSAVAAAIRRKYRTVSPNEAARLIHHAAMGAKQSEIDTVVSGGYRAWVEDQLSRPTLNIINFQTDFPLVANPSDVDYDNKRVAGGITFTTSSQLRMKVVDALGQYFVINENLFRYHSPLIWFVHGHNFFVITLLAIFEHYSKLSLRVLLWAST